MGDQGASDRLRDALLARGVPTAEVDAAIERGELGMLALDRLLLPSQPKYTRDEAAKAAGMDVELSRRLWRAMGFADIGGDEVLFTEDDVDALRSVCRFLESGLTDADVLTQQTRVIGSSMARIAASEMSAMDERMKVAGLEGDEAVELALGLMGQLGEELPRLLGYVHQRHVAAQAKLASFAREGAGNTIELAVGFADLVGFTVLSQELDEHELAEVVDGFEALAYDVIGERQGRVVKMIGDEVMFVADDSGCAAEIGLALAEVYADHETLSDVRVGIARGPVLRHEGDYFGTTVNLASRIVNIAYAGSVVVADEVYRELLEDERFGWKPIRPRRLKGIGLTPLWAVTRPGEGSSLATGVARRVRTRRNQLRSRGR